MTRKSHNGAKRDFDVTSDSLQPGLGPVDPTSHSAYHSGPGPLADTKVRVFHGSWRDDAARVVRSSLMSTGVWRPPCMPHRLS